MAFQRKRLGIFFCSPPTFLNLLTGLLVTPVHFTKNKAMFGLFKSKREKLEKKYAKLMEESFKLSKVDRKKADAKTAEAEEVRKQIDDLNSD